MRAVHILFYRPSKDDHWLNNLVSSISPPYSHCDIQFENDIASSIYQNECVYMCKKTFSRLNYERISLTVTDQEYHNMLEFCEKKCSNQTGFDVYGMIGCFIPFYNFTPSNKTFCSRYVVEALQSGRSEYDTLTSHKTSPSVLYKFLVAKNKSFIHIPEKRITKCTV